MAFTVILGIFSLCFLHVIMVDPVFGLEPTFDVPVINVTVQEGDTAVLPCSVDFLGDHKVVWTDQWSTLLTLDDRRIIDDSRISIERPYTRDWNLHIRKAVYNDRGQYTCQINTTPVKTKIVMLVVLVPSKIVDDLSSRDITVKESDTVTLNCTVTGVPVPQVTWYKIPSDGSQAKERLDLDTDVYSLLDSCTYSLKQSGTTGEVLIIHNVSRYCDGIYECVAYNEVGPAVTRQIKVFVEFPPEISLPTRRIGQFPGRETILDCEITAYPHGVMNWKKNGRDLDIRDKQKYQMELYGGNEESKRKALSLRIKNIQFIDYGEYTCYAENYLGEDQESMILYDYSIHVSKTSTTTQATTRSRFHDSSVSKSVLQEGGDPLAPDGYPTNVDIGGTFIPGRGQGGRDNGYPRPGYDSNNPGQGKALGSNMEGSATTSVTSFYCMTGLVVSYYVIMSLLL